MEKTSETLVHPFPPFVGSAPRVLILGSFPSVKSREAMFYYGNPQNRFWRVTSAVFGEPTPITAEEKRAFLDKCGVALWDVIGSCRITGSSDSSITDATVNDIPALLKRCGAERVFTNGKKAFSLYTAHVMPVAGVPAICLPSTSPANAAWSLERLEEAWRQILDYSL